MEPHTQSAPRTGTGEDVPSGLPAEEPEERPLGVDDAEPEGEGEPPRGPGAMPGIPDEDEPAQAG
jgi:hypothetical protein